MGPRADFVLSDGFGQIVAGQIAVLGPPTAQHPEPARKGGRCRQNLSQQSVGIQGDARHQLVQLCVARYNLSSGRNRLKSNAQGKQKGRRK